mmetsp:Transcript_62315/g.135043  ORF Transcript_62315/g.135043 Transcript_62315/m.135043 type:complete len:109 (+) Transcript_62315:369-695(+)
MNRELFVGNLPNGTSESELSRLMSQFGVVESCQTNKLECYGFCKFDKLYDAIKAVEEGTNLILNGNLLRLDYSEKNGSKGKNNKNKDTKDRDIGRDFTDKDNKSSSSA